MLDNLSLLCKFDFKPVQMQFSPEILPMIKLQYRADLCKRTELFFVTIEQILLAKIYIEYLKNSRYFDS